MFIECQKENVLFLICAASVFIHHKNAVSYASPFYHSALSFLIQTRKECSCHWTKFVWHGTSFSRTIFLTRSRRRSTSAPCIPNFGIYSKMIFTIEMDSMRHEQSQKNYHLVSEVSKTFLTSDVEASTGPKIWKDVEGSTAPVVFGNRSCTPSIIDVYLEAPVEPCKAYQVANQIRKGPPLSQPPTISWLPCRTTMLTRTAMERKTANEFQFKICDCQAVQCTTLRTELGLNNNTFASDPPPITASTPSVWKMYLIHWNINCFLSAGLCEEALEQLYKVNPHSWKQSALTSVTGLLSYLMTGLFVICWNTHVCERRVKSWKQWKFTLGTFRHFGWEIVENSAMVIDVHFWLYEMRR